MDAAALLTRLRAQANPANVAGMARFGINPDRTLGVPMPTLWSGLGMTRQKENEQNLPELAPGRQPTAAPKIAFGTGTA